MAKTTGPLFSVGASGQFAKTLVYDKRGWAREYVIPSNPQSTDQMTVRNILGDIQRELKTLGQVLRPQVKTALGYRWNSIVISELMTRQSGIPWARRTIYSRLARRRHGKPLTLLQGWSIPTASVFTSWRKLFMM